MNLQEIVTKRTGKAISQCSNEELYFSLLEMTKGMAEEKVSNEGGSGYQSQYTGYAKYPITDSENNFSYSVHVYSGWYGNMTDANCDHNTFIRNFQTQVPMVTSKPIMVTEIDWSPNDPDRANEGHYNEWKQWVAPNFGTWATASTSKWGMAWKAVHDHFGNIGMTITHPQEYYDIDEYLKTGKVQPGLQNAKKHGLFEECCSRSINARLTVERDNRMSDAIVLIPGQHFPSLSARSRRYI